MDIIIVLILIAALAALVYTLVIAKKKAKPKIVVEERKTEVAKEVTKAAPSISFSDRLKMGLSRSRLEVWGKLTGLFSGGLDQDKIETLEELLYGADIGTATVSVLMDEVHKHAKSAEFTEESFKHFLFDYLKIKWSPFNLWLITRFINLIPKHLSALKSSWWWE